MTGKATAGVDGPSSRLYEGQPFVLCPPSDADRATLAAVRTLVTDLGSHVVEVDAQAHDRAAALISHLPYLMSVPLLAALGRGGRAPARAAGGRVSFLRRRGGRQRFPCGATSW